MGDRKYDLDRIDRELEKLGLSGGELEMVRKKHSVRPGYSGRPVASPVADTTDSPMEPTPDSAANAAPSEPAASPFDDETAVASPDHAPTTALFPSGAPVSLAPEPRDSKPEGVVSTEAPFESATVEASAFTEEELLETTDPVEDLSEEDSDDVFEVEDFETVVDDGTIQLLDESLTQDVGAPDQDDESHKSKKRPSFLDRIRKKGR